MSLHTLDLDKTKLAAASSVFTTTTSSSSFTFGQATNKGNRKRKTIDDQSPKPRRFSTAYNFFVQYVRSEQKLQHPNVKISFGDFSRQCGLRWRNMTLEEKEPFYTMEQADRIRYAEEMKNYVPPPPSDEEAPKKKKIRRSHKKNEPIKPVTAFNYYAHELRHMVKLVNSDWSTSDVTKELRRRWNQMNPLTKQPYEVRALQDQARYEEEMKQFRSDSMPKPGTFDDSAVNLVEPMESEVTPSNPYPWMIKMTETLQNLGINV